MKKNKVNIQNKPFLGNYFHTFSRKKLHSLSHDFSPSALITIQQALLYKYRRQVFSCCNCVESPDKKSLAGPRLQLSSMKTSSMSTLDNKEPAGGQKWQDWLHENAGKHPVQQQKPEQMVEPVIPTTSSTWAGWDHSHCMLCWPHTPVDQVSSIVQSRPPHPPPLHTTTTTTTTIRRWGHFHCSWTLASFWQPCSKTDRQTERSTHSWLALSSSCVLSPLLVLLEAWDS